MTIPRTAFTLGGLALAVAACTGVLYAMGGDEPAAVQLQLASAKRGTVSASVSAAGNTASGTSRDLAFGVSGTVSKVHVKVGDRVRKGAVLARVDGTAAREQYAAAKADLAAAQDAVDAVGTCTTAAAGAGISVHLASYREPTPTPSPTPSATLSPSPSPTTHEPIVSPVPVVTVTVTATATVTVTASPSGSPTSSARPTGKPTATPGTGAKPTAKPSSTAGPRDGCGKGLSEEQAQAGVDRAEAALEEAELAVTGTRIVAPASGTVLSVAGAVGDAAGGTFISLGNLSELHVEALFTESDVNLLKLGQQAKITLATRRGESFPGTVTRVAPTATTTGRLVRYAVTVTFDEPPKNLMLGQTATVVVTTDEADQAIYVPAQAVRTRADGTAVVTVDSTAGREERAVKTGVRSDTAVQITSGLAESDRVVVTGASSGEFPDGSWPG